MKTSNGTLENFHINVRIKLAALWVVVMFCYLYGDFFTLFVPGRIQGLINGNSGIGPVSPVKLLMFAILMTLPSLMILMSLTAKPVVSRWANVSMGVFFTAIMILVLSTSISTWMMFYTFLGAIEITMTSLVIWYAWRWPKH
jgi:hypothetical protein